MKKRAVTGLFFVALMLCSFFLGERLFVLFYAALSTACLVEFYRLFARTLSKPIRLVGIGSGLAIILLFGTFLLGLTPATTMWMLILFPMLVFLVQLFEPEVSAPFLRVGKLVLGWVYVILPFCCFLGLGIWPQAEGKAEYHFVLPLGVIVLIWANDTGAYLLGRAFGKHKLFERISPGKTWEGFVGGLISSMLLSLFLHRQFGVLNMEEWLGVAALVSLSGTLGDLVESMLKRSLGIKDSGNILPGHGGFLDRFDSLLFAAPSVFVFLVLLQTLFS